MTAAQLDSARAVREELEFIFSQLGGILALEAVLETFCMGEWLPLVNGDLLAKLSAAHMAAAEAMDAYDVFLAGAAESSGPAPAEVKRAAPALVAA